MKTYCLVIDDDNQEEYFKTELQNVLRKIHIELIPIFVKPTNHLFMKGDNSGYDKAKIEKHCIQAIKNCNCSVIVSDYQIVTKKDGFTGLDILNTISTEFPYTFKVLYSGGQIKNAINRMISSLTEQIPSNEEKMSESQVYDAINLLKKMGCINELIRGKGYAETVIKYMRSSPLGLQQSFLSLMKDEYADMQFKSCYPTFKGKTLSEIGEHIEKRTTQGEDFQQALIEQTIAYLIDINKD